MVDVRDFAATEQIRRGSCYPISSLRKKNETTGRWLLVEGCGSYLGLSLRYFFLLLRLLEQLPLPPQHPYIDGNGSPVAKIDATACFSMLL